MSNDIVVGGEYFLINRCELSLPSKVVVKSVHEDIVEIIFDDGCIKLKDKEDFRILSFYDYDKAMLQMTELFKNYLSNADKVAGDLYFTYLPQDKFRLIRNKMNLNINFIKEKLYWFSCVDVNLDILGIKVHNGKKILEQDGKRYHCNQILLLYDLVIDMRFNDRPVKLNEYMIKMHRLNPNTEFELEPSLCYSFIDDAKYKFGYKDLIT